MSFDTGLTPTSELDAVNLCLFVVGESPVDTLDEDTLPESQMALKVLREESRILQTRGWSFNTDLAVKLLPDVNTSQIALPANTLATVLAPTFRGRGFVVRNNAIYWATKQTFTIPSPVIADIVLLLGFDELPEYARWCVAVRAARRFQDAQLGDGQLHQFEEKDEMAAWTEFLSREAEDAEYNVVADSPSVRGVFIRRYSYRR